MWQLTSHCSRPAACADHKNYTLNNNKILATLTGLNGGSLWVEKNKIPKRHSNGEREREKGREREKVRGRMCLTAVSLGIIANNTRFYFPNQVFTWDFVCSWIALKLLFSDLKLRSNQIKHSSPSLWLYAECWADTRLVSGWLLLGNIFSG